MPTDIGPKMPYLVELARKPAESPSEVPIKYEEVYLRAYGSVKEARACIGRYLDFYNRRRPHSSLGGGTPDHAYFTSLPIRMAA